METKQIISWLLDKAARAQDHSYARMLNQAAKRLKELDQEQKWIPVTDRLPDLELVEVKAEDLDLFPCLVVKSAPQLPKKGFVTKAWYDGGHFMDSDCIYITKYVTHWMPLPEPPKEVDNG